MSRSEQLDRLIAPTTIAVVGASTRPGWGLMTITNLENLGFAGQIFPVNPRYEQIGDRRCFASLKEVPITPDVAVFAIPAASIASGVAEAIDCDIPSAVVYASGFGVPGQGEGGEASDVEPRRRLQELCQGQIAVLGPNCLGIINYARRSATYGITMPFEHAGATTGVALVAQSGNMALTLASANRGFSFTHVISCGNQLDVSVAELLEACLRDSRVRVLAAIIEGVPDVDRLRDVLIEAANRDVPVVVLKVGGSEKGRMATMAHTGTLSGSAALFRGFFQQYGAIQVDDLDELIAVASLMSSPRRPRTSPVAVFASSGGECALISDVAESVGVELPDLSVERTMSLSSLLPSYGRASNPLDITAGGWGDAELYANVVEELAMLDSVGAIVSVADAPTVGHGSLAPGFHGIIDGLAEGSRRLGEDGPTVVLLNTISDVHGDVSRLATEKGVVSLVGIRPGLRALSLSARYAQWLRERALSETSASATDSDVGEIDELLAKSILTSQQSGPMSEIDSKRLISAYGIKSPAHQLATTEDSAVDAADSLGYPVVLKIAAPGVVHKSDVGGVLVNLRTADEVRSGARKLLDLASSLERDSTALDAEQSGVLVEELAPSGFEIIVGGRRDKDFGAVVMVGVGGVLTELLNDVALRVAPVTFPEARSMIDELKHRSLLDGYRGDSPVDVEALARTITSVSRLLVDQERVLELDINPLVASNGQRSWMALDALVVLS